MYGANIIPPIPPSPIGSPAITPPIAVTAEMNLKSSYLKPCPGGIRSGDHDHLNKPLDMDHPLATFPRS